MDIEYTEQNISYYSFRGNDQDFLESVQYWIRRVFEDVEQEFIEADGRGYLKTIRSHYKPGKMLRSRFGAALLDDRPESRKRVIKACAATELIHSATLFHDDVIDGAELRRGHPALWRDIGSTGAILVGDLFFSSSLALLLGDDGSHHHVASFVSKVKEVCAKEMIHELVYRNREIRIGKSIDIARGKTGPLFAFIGEVCGGADMVKAEALEEVGYRIGTAYQLTDDLLDVVGTEGAVGKTLGTDRKRSKYTLAQDDDVSEAFIREIVEDLCSSAIKLLWPWPELAPRLERFISTDLLPRWELKLEGVEELTAYEVG